MAWGMNGTPDTLGSAGDTLQITDLTAKKFNQFLRHTIDSGDTHRGVYNYNNDTNNVYAIRYNQNGGTDGTVTSDGSISPHSVVTENQFELFYVCSISGEEKLGIHFYIRAGTAGAGTAPQRAEVVHKFVPSPDADITRIDCTNASGAGDYAIGSNLSAIGTD